MSFEVLHQFELSWLQALQAYRTPFLDHFFKILNLFDRIEFFLILVILTWYLYSPKWGLRLFYLSIANSLINSAFKAFFQQPRPLHLDPSLGLFSFSSYGFPSGAAQTAVLLPFILIKEGKSRWAFFIGIIFFSFLSFSRVYLGVHFPSDLLGGWVIGLVIIFSFYKIYPWIENKWSEKNKENILLSLMALLLFFPLLIPSDSVFYTSFVALGSFCALWLTNTDWQIPKSKVQRSIDAFVAIFTLLGIHLLFSFLLIPNLPGNKILLKSISAFLIGFSPLYVIPPLCKMIKPPSTYS